jgi:nucleoside-diphosphate-sugar epimerase
VKVLITGGMGVIGAETSRKFVKEGHRPVIFARHRDDSLISDIIDKVDFEQGDVLDMPRILQRSRSTRRRTVHAAAFVGAVSPQSGAQHPGIVRARQCAGGRACARRERVVFTQPKASIRSPANTARRP